MVKVRCRIVIGLMIMK